MNWVPSLPVRRTAVAMRKVTPSALPIDQSVRARGEGEPEEFSPLPEPTARVDLWRHEQIVKEFIPGLIESAGLERTRSISRFIRFRGVVVSRHPRCSTV